MFLDIPSPPTDIPTSGILELGSDIAQSPEIVQEGFNVRSVPIFAKK